MYYSRKKTFYTVDIQRNKKKKKNARVFIMSERLCKTVDVSGRSVTRLVQISGGILREDVTSIKADSNQLNTLDGIQLFPFLIEFSAADNRLIRIDSLSYLTHLVLLNLKHNSISEIKGLGNLQSLQYICLAGNTIKEMKGMERCLQLRYLDLADNCITHTSDLSMLVCLETLLLHGNALSSLESIPVHFPASVLTLTLSENEIEDINQFSSLQFLKRLTQLSVMANPCFNATDTSLLVDHRSCILLWCKSLVTLDGVHVTNFERHRAGQITPTASVSIMQNTSTVKSSVNSSPPCITHKLRALEAIQQMINTQETFIRQLSSPRSMLERGAQSYSIPSSGKEQGHRQPQPPGPSQDHAGFVNQLKHRLAERHRSLREGQVPVDMGGNEETGHTSLTQPQHTGVVSSSSSATIPGKQLNPDQHFLSSELTDIKEQRGVFVHMNWDRGGGKGDQYGGDVKMDQYEAVTANNAAAKIQNAFRAHQRRKKFKIQLMRHRAAKCIQAAW